MQSLIRSHLASAVAGGLIVAGTFLLLGVTGRRTTQTIVEQGPMVAQPTASDSSALTAHAIYVREAPGVVLVRAIGPGVNSTGSGFLVDHGGHILTSYHVIAGSNTRRRVSVTFADDVRRHATVIGEDPDDDVAVLRVDMSDVPPIAPLVLGDSATVRVGDPALAIGNPYGYDRTLTSGIVSALQRQIRAPNGFSVGNVIQIDAPVGPGGSGGPLLDAGGRVVGIANSGGGIQFAVPIDTAKALLDRVR
jgi:S1-C subfamily serine protease